MTAESTDYAIEFYLEISYLFNYYPSVESLNLFHVYLVLTYVAIVRFIPGRAGKSWKMEGKQFIFDLI